MTSNKGIQHYHSNYSGRKPNPNDIQVGEIALNIPDAKLFTKDKFGNLVELVSIVVGPTGPTGPQGEQGPMGLQGPKGDKGDVGATGIQGIKGDTGEQGIQGPKGDVGLQGPKGDTGAQGIQGIKGDTGLQGATGPQGIKGDVGPQGIQGITGPQGPKGDIGATGPQGPAGSSATGGGSSVLIKPVSADLTIIHPLTNTGSSSGSLTTKVVIAPITIKNPSTSPRYLNTSGVGHMIQLYGIQGLRMAAYFKHYLKYRGTDSMDTIYLKQRGVNRRITLPYTPDVSLETDIVSHEISSLFVIPPATSGVWELEVEITVLLNDITFSGGEAKLIITPQEIFEILDPDSPSDTVPRVRFELIEPTSTELS